MQVFPIECTSRFTFKHLAGNVQAYLQPSVSKPAWVACPCLDAAGRTTDAPRKVIEVEPNARVCANVYAKGLLNLFVSRIKGSGPVLGLDVSGKRGAERSLAYEG